jgi:hypothetical protein
MVAPNPSSITSIRIPQSEFLDPLTKRPAREWLFWLQNPNLVSVDVNGGATWGYLFSNSYIEATTYVEAGTYVLAGSYIQATTHILAGDYITAGSYITAGTTVNAGTSVNAGTTVNATTDVNAGNDVNAVADVTAGANVNVGGYVATPTYVEFNTNPGAVSDLARLSWNSSDQTLDLGMEYDVTQQIGQETYARVRNTTGVTIPNGSAVGFAGAATDALLVTPYIADGSLPTLYILGIMTHDLPDSGEKGYCTTWGFVRDIDTSAFSNGDILYVSPSVAGELTNVKPTAPDNVIPIAACVVSDATNGVIFVRPTIQQQQYYGQFSRTTDTSPAVINTAYPIVLSGLDIGNGVVLGTPASRIVVPQSGLYTVSANLQLTSGSATDKNVWFWVRKNGTDVANSARLITVSVNNAYTVVSLREEVSLNANEYIELCWASDSTNVTLDAVAATAFAPAAPAVVVNVTQAQQ